MVEHNLKIGQEIFLKAIGNNARHGEKIVKAKINSIKNKYFYVVQEGWSLDIKFRLENMVEADDFANWKAYLSEQDILDEREALNLNNKFRDKFTGRSSLSLDQLRRIDKILDEVIQ